MRLRPLLSSCVVVALALVAAHLAMIASNARNSDQLEREREAIEVIARDAAGLLGLTQDFALHQDDRSQRQWGLVHAEVVRTLRAYAAAGAVQLDEADDLLEVAQGLPDLFKSLRAALAAPDTPRAAARRETLSDQTINETRRISDGAFEVSHRVAERAQREVVIQRWVAIAAQTALLSLRNSDRRRRW